MITRKDGTSHVFNIVNQSGKIQYLDGQLQGVAPSIHFDKKYVNGIYVMPTNWLLSKSKKFLETGDIKYMAIGNGAIIFDNETGQIIRTGTAMPSAYYIEEYEKKKNNWLSKKIGRSRFRRVGEIQ